jgi:signal transduction histidine kinase
MNSTTSQIRRMTRGLVAAMLLAIALIAGLSLVSLSGSRAAFEQRAVDAAENIAHGMGRAVTAEIGRVGTALQSVVLALEREGGAAHTPPAVLAQVLAAQRSLMPEVDGLRIADATGRVLDGRGVPADRLFSVADREYFVRARAGADSSLIVSEPVLGRISQKWVVVVARRLSGPDGSFAGIVFATLDSAFFERLFQPVDLGPQGAISLRSASQRLIARRAAAGDSGGSQGSNNVSAQLAQAIQAAPDEGNYVARTALDGIERVNVYVRLKPLPLVVIVGLATDDFLAPWLHEVLVVGVLATLLVLLMLASSWLGWRAWMRSAEAEQHRRELAQEQALRTQAERHARELDALLTERSDMLDVMAHEVRQPLNNASAALQGAATALATVGDTVASQRVVRAQNVLGHVLASIDNTLAVASLLAGAGPIERSDTDIDTLVAVCIADMPAGERGRIRVERQTSARTASMDMSLMRLALRNLLSNALKYSPPGSEVTVRISDHDDPLALWIEVIDRGPGIDAELASRMFERGARGHHPDGPSGLGLGLHIVRRVMQMHGGDVDVVAEPDGFVMRLVVDEARSD